MGDRVAIVYVRGGERRTTQLVIGSAAQLQPLCQAGNTTACGMITALERTAPGEVAIWSSSGVTPPTVTPDVLQAMSNECATRKAAACTAVAAVLEQGLGVAPDPVRAQGYFQSGCNLGAAAACMEILPAEVAAAVPAMP
jgi:TPR repeat protein